MARELEEGLYDFIHRIIEEMMLRYGKFEEAFLLSALVIEKTVRRKSMIPTERL